MNNRHRRPPRQRSSPAPANGAPSKNPVVKGAIVEGRLQLKSRSGFILSETPGEADVLVQGASLRLAMNDDRVRARITGAGEGGRRLGEIVEVIERARSSVVGEVKRSGGNVMLEPDGGEPAVRVADLNGFSPADGDMAVVKITGWPSRDEAASGTLIQVLGPRSKPGVDLQALVHKYELPNEFPRAVEAEAEAFGDEVPAFAYAERENFFDKTVVTIDGADAKDFDDAISIETLPGGNWRLGVHIADVAAYVKPGTALDEEAYRRGTSVYLTGSVLPMLPFALSANLCSLRPDRVRLTLSCVMDIDSTGRVMSSRLCESAIRSARRFTYSEVEATLKGEAPSDLSPAMIENLKEMDKLARILRRRRFSRGSLDFDFPEPDVIMDHRGRPVDIRRRERMESHRLIEDFMLLANETVAETMSKAPFLYRVHEKPDPAKLEKLSKTLQAVGVTIPAGFGSGSPMPLQKIIAATEGRPIQKMVQMMTLRSLKQAIYSPNNAGHFGLASTCYTHFTSPIRRYPDLIVHRLVKEKVHHQLGGPRQQEWAHQLPKVCLYCSRRERVAVDAEREFLDLQKVRLMEERVGEVYSGTITSVTNFGFFVELKEFFVEGLVHISSLEGDYYIYDEVRVTLRGRRTGRTFRVGQAVRVQLAGANISKRQLDLQLLPDSPAERAPEAPEKIEREERRSGPRDRRSGSPDRRQSQPGAKPHSPAHPRRGHQNPPSGRPQRGHQSPSTARPPRGHQPPHRQERHKGQQPQQGQSNKGRGHEPGNRPPPKRNDSPYMDHEPRNESRGRNRHRRRN